MEKIVMTQLKFFKLHSDVQIPKMATEQSACFDISFCSHGKEAYKGFNKQNAPVDRPLATGNIQIMPGERLLIPTGYILDIPEGYSVRLHARSGLSLKQGLVLANAEGVIDSDYVEELFVMIHNISDNKQWINNGDRIAQGELVKQETYELTETKEKPQVKTSRNGGLGSTGISEIKAKKIKKTVDKP
jgi:dUTP pyrophosphatase